MIFNIRPLSAALLLSLSAGGAAWSAAPPRAAVLQELLDCRSVDDGVRRLACYDAAVGRVAKAEDTGDVIVVDKAQAQTARKQAFGFNLPALALFDRGQPPEALDRVILNVERAYKGADGRWVVEVEGGARWAQTDDQYVAKAPKPGSQAEFRKAAMSGFFMKLDGQLAVRARRIQ